IADGKRILQSMIGYTRDGIGPPEAFSVPELIEGTTRPLNREFLAGLQTHLNIEANLPEAIGYPGRLKQMLLNFLVNASETIEGRGDLWIDAHLTKDPPSKG